MTEALGKGEKKINDGLGEGERQQSIRSIGVAEGNTTGKGECYFRTVKTGDDG